jgi:hypothetical protein
MAASSGRMFETFRPGPKGRRLIRLARPLSAARRLTIAGFLAALCALLVVSNPLMAWAGPGESTFLSATNSLRAANGLGPYRVCADLTAVAQTWAAHMAATDVLSHNPSYEDQISNWRSLGENVGEGASVSSIHQALVASPGHRANLLSSRFTEVGIGTAVDASGRIYVDEVFRTPRSGSCGSSAPTSVGSATPKTRSGLRAAVTPPAPAPAPTPPAATPMPKPPIVPASLPDRDSIGRAFEFHQTFAPGPA